MPVPEGPTMLLCYDGSAGARQAIQTAAGLLAGHRAIAYYAWSPIDVIIASPIGLMSGAYGTMDEVKQLDDDLLAARARDLAEEGARLAIDAGLDARPATSPITVAGTCHAILEAADEHDARLVVVGARGRSAARSLVLGSVSRDVLEHSRRPVLVVPSPRRRGGPRAEGPTVP